LLFFVESQTAGGEPPPAARAQGHGRVVVATYGFAGKSGRQHGMSEQQWLRQFVERSIFSRHRAGGGTSTNGNDIGAVMER